MSDPKPFPIPTNADVKAAKEAEAKQFCEDYAKDPRHKAKLTWRWGWRGIEYHLDIRHQIKKPL